MRKFSNDTVLSLSSDSRGIFCLQPRGQQLPGFLHQVRLSIYNCSLQAGCNIVSNHCTQLFAVLCSSLLEVKRPSELVSSPCCRDGIKFPDMVHALKPSPKTHIQEPWRIMDFFSHVPESMHMVGGTTCDHCCTASTIVFTKAILSAD